MPGQVYSGSNMEKKNRASKSLEFLFVFVVFFFIICLFYLFIFYISKKNAKKNKIEMILTENKWETKNPKLKSFFSHEMNIIGV
jgi:ABC-type phosphate transport system permease subunit